MPGRRINSCWCNVGIVRITSPKIMGLAHIMISSFMGIASYRTVEEFYSSLASL
jgi:hypothetical protein